MKKYIVAIVWLCFINSLHAQQVISGPYYFVQVAESYAELGHSLTGNARQPAALPDSNRFGVSFRGQHLSGFKGPMDFLLVSGFRMLSGRVICSVEYSRFGPWAQSQFGIGYGMKLSPTLSLGLKMNFYQMKTLGYGSVVHFPVEAGILYHINPSLTTGLSVYNISGIVRMKPADAELPSVIILGWSYQFSKEIVSTLLVAWQETQPVVISPSIKLKASRLLEFGIGYASTFNSWNISSAYRLRGFMINFCILYYHRLGFINALGIDWWKTANG